MDNFVTHLCQELRQTAPLMLPKLLVFIAFLVAFGVLSSNHSALWEAYLPILLMGLSFCITTLSTDQVFREDWEDGTLEWRLSTSASLERYVLLKVLAHWICLGLPLTLIVGVILSFSSMLFLFGIATTTIALTLLGAVGGAVCLTAKGNTSVLYPLIMLPLGVPIMIVSMASAFELPISLSTYLGLQGGLLLITFALSLAACPFALRLAFK